MASDWQTRCIGDLGKVVTGKTPSTKVTENFGGPYPFITIPDMDGRRKITTSERSLSEKGAAALRTCKLPADAVMMSCIATIGRCGITTRPSFTNQQINSLICGPDVDPSFVYYSFTQLGQALEAAGGGGSVYTNVSKSRFENIEIKIPPLPEQKAIARILGTLDDKIELNRRMNATLEAMARVLFQSWFVDALPNDGSFPDGWELSTIGAEAKVGGGSTPSTKSPEFWDNGEFHWVTPKDFSSLQSKVLVGSSRKVTQAGLDQITSGLLPENTVLLSSRAPVGYLALTKINTAINQGFIAMICHGRLPPEYVMLWADSIMDKIKQAASGTTFAEISKATFRPFPIIVPSADRLSQFTDIVRAFYERIAANERQSATLAETRDTLLPRLLRGELRTEEVVDAG